MGYVVNKVTPGLFFIKWLQFSFVNHHSANPSHCHDLEWLIRQVLDWMIGLLHLIHSHNSGLQAMQCYRWFIHFTVHPYVTHTHTRILSSLVVSWQQIYHSVSLQITWSLLITVTFLSCHYSAAANSVQFQAHILEGWHPETRLFTSRLLFYTDLGCQTFLYYHFSRTTQKTASIVDTDLLLSNGRHIVARVSLCGNVLPSRCLAMGLYVT
jgi:hypothetical protein